MINIFLDDLRPAPEGFVHAKTVEEAIELLSYNQVNILSLDFDLNGEDSKYNKTGYDVCVWLTNEWWTYRNRGIFDSVISPSKIFIHTGDPNGRGVMYELLTHWKPPQITVVKSPMPEYNLATGERFEYI